MKQAVESNSDRMRRMRESAAEPELTLAERINAAHRDYHQLLQGALKRAIQIGKMLVEAKQQVKHGQWLPWLKQNCPLITDRTASNYIRVAANQNEISDLSGVAEAIKFLSGSQSGDEDPPVRALPAAPKPSPVSVNRPPVAALPSPAPRQAETIIDAEFEEVEDETPPAELSGFSGQLTEIEAIRVWRALRAIWSARLETVLCEAPEGACPGDPIYGDGWKITLERMPCQMREGA